MRREKRERQDRERYWRVVLERWRRSGESVRSFCREEGVSEFSFYRWRKRFGAEEREGSRFAAVELVESRGLEGSGEGSANGVEVVLREGRVVRVSRGFDAETFRRVLMELEGMGC